MESEKQFVCMKWGKFYTADYVNRLYNSVKRHTTPPFTFYCLTNESEGINPEVKILPCPTVPIPHPMCVRGWRKVSLWGKPEITGLNGQILFLDLDLIITGSLDEFFTYQGKSDYLVMYNYTTPGRNIGNTSVFRLTVGAHPEVYEKLLAEPLEMQKAYRNSQTFVSRTAPSMDFWPDPWIRHYKTHCLRPWPLYLFLQPRIFPDAKIIACTGHPRPDELVEGKWKSPWYKKFYKHTPPVKFVQENWR
ncbi:MAG: hypothetical protein IJR99_04540 [Kiritimatiellae bacterium]|nr:hypothetical protein [Kiritimatiellia bacterium]